MGFYRDRIYPRLVSALRDPPPIRDRRDRGRFIPFEVPGGKIRIESSTTACTAPPNFVRIVELNESGNVLETAPTDPEAGANRCAVR